jgi:hypothetical protein
MKSGNIGMKILKKLENNLLEGSMYLCNCLQYCIAENKQEQRSELDGFSVWETN